MRPEVSGRQFEKFFEKIALMRGFHPERINNGFQITQTRPFRGFPLKNPFDYILEHEELGLAFLDLKTIATKTFPVLLIKPHQIRALDKFSKHVVSGFLCWHRKIDRIVFYEAKQAILKTKLSHDEGLDIGDLSNMDLMKLMRSRDHSSNSNTDNSNQDIPQNR